MANSANSANTSLKFQKPVTIRNKKYIEFIKSLRCCVCGFKSPSDPHHVSLEGHGAKGMKCSDDRAIPLCHLHHVEYHNTGRQTFATRYDLDYEKLISYLQRYYEDHHETKRKEGDHHQRTP